MQFALQMTKIVVISTEDSKTKGFLFGREKSKLKDMQELVNRYFKVEIIGYVQHQTISLGFYPV